MSFSLAKESSYARSDYTVSRRTTGAALDLKEKATSQFEKIADKATNTFRDGFAATTLPLRRASMAGTRFQLLCMDGQ